MTVKELIHELQLCNENLEVLVDLGAGLAMDIRSVAFHGVVRTDDTVELTYAGQGCVTLRESPHDKEIQ